jgi:hypothetical protein
MDLKKRRENTFGTPEYGTVTFGLSGARPSDFPGLNLKKNKRHKEGPVLQVFEYWAVLMLAVIMLCGVIL